MLITISGQPRSGKSTLLQKAVEGRLAYGFTTQERLDGKSGQREGFDLVSSQGAVAVLAAVGLESDLKVSRYSVDLASLNAFLAGLRDPRPDEIVYVDEVGEMELFSAEFELLVERWNSQAEILIVTLSEVFEHPLINKLKASADAHIGLTAETRPAAAQQLDALLAELA